MEVQINGNCELLDRLRSSDERARRSADEADALSARFVEFVHARAAAITLAKRRGLTRGIDELDAILQRLQEQASRHVALLGALRSTSAARRQSTCCSSFLTARADLKPPQKTLSMRRETNYHDCNPRQICGSPASRSW